MSSLMGVLRSPHEATGRSLASRFYEGAAMPSYHRYLPITFTPDRHGEDAGHHRCRPDEDFDADPRLIPGVSGATIASRDWGCQLTGVPRS